MAAPWTQQSCGRPTGGTTARTMSRHPKMSQHGGVPWGTGAAWGNRMPGERVAVAAQTSSRAISGTVRLPEFTPLGAVTWARWSRSARTAVHASTKLTATGRMQDTLGAKWPRRTRARVVVNTQRARGRTLCRHRRRRRRRRRHARGSSFSSRRARIRMPMRTSAPGTSTRRVKVTFSAGGARGNNLTCALGRVPNATPRIKG